jgi:hypothetical protein
MSWTEADFTLRERMRNARLRVIAGLAGATLCLFAATSYAQNPTTTGTAGTDANAQTAAQPTTPTDQATTPAPTDQVTTTGTATDVTTQTTTTRTFPGGTLGILAVAVLILLVLFALFRGRDRTVIRETTTTTPPVTRSPGMGTSADDRLNVNSRAASGPGTNSGGMNDPNARR